MCCAVTVFVYANITILFNLEEYKNSGFYIICPYALHITGYSTTLLDFKEYLLIILENKNTPFGFEARYGFCLV